MPVLSIQCVVACQWLKLYVSTFHQFLTFQIIHCTSSQQLSFLPFQIAFKPRLTVLGELQMGWEAEAGVGSEVVLKS